MTPNPHPQDAVQDGTEDATQDATQDATGVGELVESDLLVEDVSIDGMCGVY
jgi:mycofactocin precursor